MGLCDASSTMNVFVATINTLGMEIPALAIVVIGCVLAGWFAAWLGTIVGWELYPAWAGNSQWICGVAFLLVELDESRAELWSETTMLISWIELEKTLGSSRLLWVTNEGNLVNKIGIVEDIGHENKGKSD